MHKPEETGRAEMLTRQCRRGGGSDLGPAPRTRFGEGVNDVSGNVMVLAEHTGLKVSEGDL